MHFKLSVVALLLGWLSPFATPSEAYPSDPHSFGPVTIVHQFAPGVWVENLAVRPNGLILPVTTTSSILYQIDPDRRRSELPVVYDFEAGGNALQGITEVEPDVFAVEVARCNITALSCTPGGYSVWQVDPRGCARHELGGFWVLDMATGQSSLAIRDGSMAGTASVPTGISGVGVAGGQLWYTNSARGTLNRLPVDRTTGQSEGSATEVVSGLTPDDFELGRGVEEAHVCNGVSDQVVVTKLDQSGIRIVVANLPGPTSARWGRRRGRGRGNKGERPLYVSTLGGLEQFVTRNFTVGGTISKLRYNSTMIL